MAACSASGSPEIARASRGNVAHNDGNQFCSGVYENEPSCKWASGTKHASIDDAAERFPLAGEDSTQAARMSPRSQNRFNPREVARALKAARLAGERPDVPKPRAR
jgi:hypothetical protein